MASLSQIVNVNIALSTTSVPRGTFGVPMIIAGTHKVPFTERVRTYLDYNSAVEDDLDEEVLQALSAVFSQTPRPQMCKVGRVDDFEEMHKELSAIQAEDPNWYGFGLAARGLPELQLKAAEWAETQTKIFFAAFTLDEMDEYLPELSANNYLRTAVVIDNYCYEQSLDMAWMGRCFTIAPGGETWALKQLAGVKASKFSATEQQDILKKGGNTFEQFAPQIYLTTPGKMVNGEWIDVVRFRDWLENYIQTSVTTLMINRKKVPYTDGGIALIVNNLTSCLREGQRVGGIAPDEVDSEGNNVKGFEIIYPRSVEVSFQDKAERVLNISFSARLAGAIHLTNIDGNLSYELQ